jgi:hypothetical protein
VEGSLEPPLHREVEEDGISKVGKFCSIKILCIFHRISQQQQPVVLKLTVLVLTVILRR